MKMHIVLMNVLFFSSMIKAEEPMIVKIQPVVLGEFYSEPDGFFDLLLEGSGLAFSLDASVELVNKDVVRQQWRTSYHDLSQLDIQKLLNGQSSIESNLLNWSSDAIPVIFIDSVDGYYLYQDDIEVYSGNGRLVVCLGFDFTDEWFSRISHGIGKSLGLSNSSDLSNQMNPNSDFWSSYFNDQQVKKIRNELVERGLDFIPRVLPKFIQVSGSVNKKLVFQPENLVDGIFYLWEVSFNLKNWRTLDPNIWNVSSGQYLRATSDQRQFYRLRVVPVHEKFMD